MEDFHPKIPEPQERIKVSPYFQLVLIIISVSILAFSFYFRMVRFRTLDEPVQHESLTPKTLRDFGGAPEYINVGLHINRFLHFDITKNKFEFTGDVWFDLEADAVSIESLENFTFDRGTIVHRSEPDISLDGSRLMVRYLVRVDFNTGLDFSDFPFDDHRVTLILTHPFLSPEEVIFRSRSTDFKYRGNLIGFGWHFVGRSVVSGFTSAPLSDQSPQKLIQQPLVGFLMDAERHGSRFILAILLPILLIHFLMYFCLSVDKGPSISIALGGLTGALAYRYVIEQLSPITGDLMLSDHFFFLFLVASGFIFLLNIIDVFILRLPLYAKKLGIIVIHLFSLSVVVYFLTQ